MNSTITFAAVSGSGKSRLPKCRMQVDEIVPAVHVTSAPVKLPSRAMLALRNLHPGGLKSKDFGKVDLRDGYDRNGRSWHFCVVVGQVLVGVLRLTRRMGILRKWTGRRRLFLPFEGVEQASVFVANRAVVHPAWRRLGIFDLLMALGLQHAKTQGVEVVVSAVEVDEGNRFRAPFDRLGFTEIPRGKLLARDVVDRTSRPHRVLEVPVVLMAKDLRGLAPSYFQDSTSARMQRALEAILRREISSGGLPS